MCQSRGAKLVGTRSPANTPSHNGMHRAGIDQAQQEERGIYRTTAQVPHSGEHSGEGAGPRYGIFLPGEGLDAFQSLEQRRKDLLGLADLRHRFGLRDVGRRADYDYRRHTHDVMRQALYSINTGLIEFHTHVFALLADQGRRCREPSASWHSPEPSRWKPRAASSSATAWS